MTTIPLSEAALCVSCDRIFPISEKACPSCTATQRLLLGRIIKPMKDVANEYRLPDMAGAIPSDVTAGRMYP